MPTIPTGLIEPRGHNPLTDAPRRDRLGRGEADGRKRAAAINESAGAGSIKSKRGLTASKAGDDEWGDFSKALSRTLDRREEASPAKDLAESAPERKNSAAAGAEAAVSDDKDAAKDGEKAGSGDRGADLTADAVKGEAVSGEGVEQTAAVTKPVTDSASVAVAEAAVNPAPAAAGKLRGGAGHSAAKAGDAVGAAADPTSGETDAASKGAQGSQGGPSQGEGRNGAASELEIKFQFDGAGAPAATGSKVAAAVPASEGGQTQASSLRGVEGVQQATTAGETASAASSPGSQAAPGLDGGNAQGSFAQAETTSGTGSSLSSALGLGGPKSAEMSAGAPTVGTQSGQSAGSAHTAGSGEMTQLESLVARGLGASLAQRGGTLTMRLTPDSLGAMRIQMDVQQGVVNVSLDVANPQAHRLLMESIDTLRSSLEARGLAVEKIGVNLTPGNFGSSGIAGAGTASQTGNGNPHGGGGSSGTGDQNAQRQDANGQFANHDAGDGRSRSWLGGDQREQHRSPGGAAAHAPDRTDAEAESFGGLWQRLRLGVDTRV